MSRSMKAVSMAVAKIVPEVLPHLLCNIHHNDGQSASFPQTLQEIGKILVPHTDPVDHTCGKQIPRITNHPAFWHCSDTQELSCF